MRLRAQPPVHSPLPLGALAAGVRTLFGDGKAAAHAVERRLAELYAPHAVLLTDSGTSALRLALELATRERPGRVALPAYCCYDVATAADGAGVDFVLYDLDPATLGPDARSLRGALERGARSVVIAHLYGIPIDWTAVEAIAREFDALVIEDAAQAAGTRIGGRLAGTFGRYAVLSFGRGKGVTGGRGGALLANAPDAAANVDALRGALGAARGGVRELVALGAQWLLARPAVYGLPSSLPALGLGATVYRAPHRAAHASPASLAVLARTLPLGEAEAEIRRRNARRLLAHLEGLEGLRGYAGPAGAEPGFLRLPVLVAAELVPRVHKADARALGVWPAYPRSLADLEGFGERRANRADPVPGARALAARLITCPTHSRLGPAALAVLERWMSGVARPADASRPFTGRPSS